MRKFLNWLGRFMDKHRKIASAMAIISVIPFLKLVDNWMHGKPVSLLLLIIGILGFIALIFLSIGAFFRSP